jgi:hypothetical protein
MTCLVLAPKDLAIISPRLRTQYFAFITHGPQLCVLKNRIHIEMVSALTIWIKQN